MKYIKFHASTGFCGCDQETYVAVKEENFNEDAVQEFLNDMIYDNASSYMDFADMDIGEMSDYDSEEEFDEAYAEAAEEYLENCSGYWEFVTKEEWEENNGDTWED